MAKEKTAKSKSSKLTMQTASAGVNTEESKLPDRGDDGWYPLRLLLDHYAPGVLATAIEKHGIYTNDDYARLVHCTSKYNSEKYKQALALLADWQSELDDPEPEYPWDSERYDDGSHPTEYWRLPDKVVKGLAEINHGAQSLSGSEDKPYWTKRPLEEFEKELRELGSQEKAGQKNGVTRQRYSQAYNKVKKAGEGKFWPGKN